MFGRRKVAALVAEFLGTGILTLLVLSVQRSTIGVPFFVALIAGLTMALMYFVIGESSGAHINPAVTIGLWTARRITTLRAVLYIAFQMLGAWGAYYLYTYFVNSKLQVVGGHYTGRILVAEAVGAGVFAFGWAAASYQLYTTAVRASVIGLSYMVGIVAASSASIGLLNPGLALGVRAWVWGTYVLGPILGAVIGINLYGLLFAEDSAIRGAAAYMSTGRSSKVTTLSSKKTAPLKTKRKK